jgi:hypothetical protein
MEVSITQENCLPLRKTLTEAEEHSVQSLSYTETWPEDQFPGHNQSENSFHVAHETIDQKQNMVDVTMNYAAQKVTLVVTNHELHQRALQTPGRNRRRKLLQKLGIKEAPTPALPVMSKQEEENLLNTLSESSKITFRANPGGVVAYTDYEWSLITPDTGEVPTTFEEKLAKDVAKTYRIMGENNMSDMKNLLWECVLGNCLSTIKSEADLKSKLAKAEVEHMKMLMQNDQITELKVFLHNVVGTSTVFKLWLDVTHRRVVEDSRIAIAQCKNLKQTRIMTCMNYMIEIVEDTPEYNDEMTRVY